MAVSASTGRPHNLPADFTSFVGREHEIPAIKRLLGEARLVTLTGPGGVGKTRLALRAANELRRGFRDGVWFVELAGLHDTALVPQTLTAALGIQGTADNGPLESLVQFLQSRNALLVRDNCEHLVSACAGLVEMLLRSCPDLRILATSRQLLHVGGEHVLPVPPLPVPDSDANEPPETLGRYAAVQLFVDRASAVTAGFVMDTRNQEAVAEICRRLDGIPLAIELAASRLRLLSVHQLRDRLDDRYALLTSGSAVALPRQKTLRALIDWSFELCSPAEQLLWSRLSVFGDGFELDAAESVCADESLLADDIFDALTGLVDKSVVTVEPHGQRVRHHLSETLREYGHEHLSENEERRLRRRHRDWCTDLVQRAAEGWFTPDQVALFTKLQREHGNLRVALGFCLNEPGEAPVGLLMASLLRFYWLMSGRPAEGRHWHDRLLARHPTEDAVRLRALRVNAHLTILLGDYAVTEELLAEAREIAGQLDDRSATAFVTQVRGLSAMFQRDAARAAALLEEALEEHRALGDQAAAAYDELQLTLATVLLGDHDRALEFIDDALRICEPSGEHWTTSSALFALGIVACRVGDHERAVDAGRRSIRLRLPLQDKLTIGLSFDALAWSAAATGDGVRAARLFGAARAVQRALGISPRTFGHLAELHALYEPMAREALGDPRFDREQLVGEQLVFDEAVEYALGAEASFVEPRVVADQAAGGLTRREREIAELVARGMSNKEIAAALVISQRTAEGHVEHILAKLNFTSRTQVATWIARQGMATE